MVRNRYTFSTLTVLLLVFAAPLMGGLAAAQTAHTARIEVHSFDTVTLTNKQFLTGAKDGKPARIGGELRLPPGTGRFPAVILVHGSDGVGANVDLWAQELNGIGVAAFLLDSFTGRGIVQTITDQSQLGFLAMIVDAYRALELLSNHPRIDAARIAVMGFSRGGFVALYSSMRRFQRLYGPANVEFAAYLPFYGPCGTRFIDDEQLSDRPIRIFHGAADDFVPVEPCQRYVERLRRAGKDVQLTVYPGARHAFDNPLFQPVRSLPDAEVSTRCRREERAGGEIINLDTGQPFSRSDACVTRGATVGYDPHGHAESVKAVKEFLKSTWKLSQ
jgi:dienelactone hydrolase